MNVEFSRKDSMTTDNTYDLLCIGNYTKDTIISPAGSAGAAETSMTGTGVSVDCAVTSVSGRTEACRTASCGGNDAASTSATANWRALDEDAAVVRSRCPAKKTVESRETEARARMKR